MKLKEIIEEYTELRRQNGSVDPVTVMVFTVGPGLDNNKPRIISTGTPDHGLDLTVEMTFRNGVFASEWIDRTDEAGTYLEKYVF